MRATAYSAILAVVVTWSVACGGGSRPAESGAGATAPTTDGRQVSMDKASYPVFPNADSGADPSVSAEQGGRGFTGKGWETNTDFDLIGDPRAVKGGRFREAYLDFPNTLRYRGPNVTEFGAMVNGLVYEPLLTLHPTTLEWMPQIATHWQISPDRMTYRYRIDPNARWSDGQPVVADDVVATWMFMMDKGLQDPSAQLVFEKFDKPVAESKYIVSVKSKVLNWRNFLYFSASMPLYPAHVLKNLDGARYIKEYNYKMLPGTGPYVVNESDVVRGNSITIRRRNDYWADKYRRSIGVNNFDEIQEVVVRDENLAFEMFKRGDLDYHYVADPRQWVQEMNFDRVQTGIVQKRKIFNEYPQSLVGIGFNTRREPWSDIRVRRAIAHLFNRDLFISKLFFNEYTPKNSYFFGNYENPNNPKTPYDPQLAVKLLTEAGWTRNAQGQFVKNGRPLTMDLVYYSKLSEPPLTVFQEDLRKVGIALNLRLVTFETMGRLIDDRMFDTVYIGYTGLLFPNPETSVHSSLADQNNTNNITGFKSARVDELLKAYDVEFDQAKREAIIREIDGILANEYHYVLRWDAPFFRVAYQNKFGHPDSYLTRYGDNRDPLWLWWIDPEKAQQLAQATRDGSAKLTVGPTDIHYWENWTKQQPSPVATQ